MILHLGDDVSVHSADIVAIIDLTQSQSPVTGAMLAEIRRRRKWQQMGQQIHKYKNLLNREFHADRLNSKWVTDISYIITPKGTLYLSMIRDLFDNSIVAYKTGTQQTVNLVLDTIRLAVRKEKKRAAAELQLHSDQGFQYNIPSIFPAD